MSTNLRGSFALACSESTENCVEIDAPSGVSFSSGSVFTVGATFLASANKASGILMRQQGVFSLGLNEGVPVFVMEDLGTFFGDLDTAVQANTWITVVVSSDGSTLKLYVGGIEVYNTPVNTVSVESASDGTNAVPGMANVFTRWELGLISGYMREVFAVSRALCAEEIISQAFAKQSSLNNLDLFADFNCQIPIDKGKSGLSLQLKGSCTTVDLVRALVPGQTGYALAHQTKALKQAFLSNIFTVYTNVFTKVSAAVDDTYIFSCCLVDNVTFRKSASVFAFGITDHLTTPFVECGSLRVESSVKLRSSQWFSLVLAVNGLTLTLYIDGEQAAQATLSEPFSITAECLPVIGANLDSAGKVFGSFGGYIDSVGVFSDSLSQETLKDFAKTPPFLFDEGCVALWHFSYEYPIDLKSLRAVTMANDAQICLCQNTLRTEDLPSFTFREPTGQSSLSEVQAWQAEAAVQVLFSSVCTLFGINPSRCVEQVSGSRVASNSCLDPINSAYYKPVGEALDLVRDTLVEQAAPQTLIETGKVTSAAIAETLSSVEFGSYTTVLTETFYGTGTMEFVGGIARLEAMWEGVSSSGYLDAATFTLFTAAIASQMSSWGQSHKSPEADDDTDTDDGVSLHLESLQFYSADNLSKGSVCICADFGEDPVLPEYKRKQRSEDVMFVRIDASTVPQIKAEFEVTAVEEPTSVRLRASVYGSDDLLGSLDEQTITVTSSGTYTVCFPLSHHALENAPIGLHEITFQWFADNEVMGSTDHTIHVLYHAPRLPWTADQEGESGTNIPLPVLELSEEVMKAIKDSGKDISVDSFCDAFVDWLHIGSRFKGVAFDHDPLFSGWSPYQKSLFFDFALLNRAMKNKMNDVVELASLDSCCLGLALACVQGISRMGIAALSSRYDAGSLTLHDCRPFGGYENFDEYTPLQHFVLASLVGTSENANGVTLTNEGIHGASVAKSGDNITLVPYLLYDAYLELLRDDKQAVSVKALPLKGVGDEDCVYEEGKGSYWARVCAIGSSCEIALVKQAFNLGEVPKRKIIVDPSTGQFGKDSKRPNFLGHVSETLKVPPYSVRCHGLSFHDIEDLLITIVNSSNDYNKSEALLLLWRAVFRNRSSDEGDPPRPIPSDDPIEEASLFLTLQIMETLAVGRYEKEELAGALTRVERLYNSSLANLTLGASDWNVAIRESFDPREWMCVVSDSGDLVVLSSNVTLTPSPYEREDLPELIDEGIYLTNADDGFCLSCLRMPGCYVDVNSIVAPKIVAVMVSTVGEAEEEDGEAIPIPIIMSSKNAWNLKDRLYSQYNEAIPIYYLSLDESSWITF